MNCTTLYFFVCLFIAWESNNVGGVRLTCWRGNWKSYDNLIDRLGLEKISIGPNLKHLMGWAWT